VVTARRAGLPLTFKGTLRIGGSAPGTLRLKGHSLAGSLGGRRVSARV
jgi:hypothetical protein